MYENIELGTLVFHFEVEILLLHFVRMIENDSFRMDGMQTQLHCDVCKFVRRVLSIMRLVMFYVIHLHLSGAQLIP
jgi:hypothetical protein